MTTISTAIFGGSFNPIHNGHIAIARYVLRATDIQSVWLMVSPQNPFKRCDELFDDDSRMAIVRAAVQGMAGIEACDYEMRLPRPSYMCATLRSLRETMPERTFTLLIGADNWLRFNDWRDHDDILRHHDILVYPRKGSDIDEQSLPPNVTLIHTPLINVSSTCIRHRIAQHEDISGLVPESVRDLITESYGEGYPRQ